MPTSRTSSSPRCIPSPVIMSSPQLPFQNYTHPPRIDFDADPHTHPEIFNLLRDFTSDYSAYVNMREPPFRLRELIVRAMGLLLYSFDFPEYYQYPSGVYREVLEVSFFVPTSLTSLMISSQQLVNGSITASLPAVSRKEIILDSSSQLGSIISTGSTIAEVPRASSNLQQFHSLRS
jgi:hypothetical protein